MKKALLALCAVVTLSASAVTNQFTAIPAEGTIDKVSYPGGIGSIELNCVGEINRNCTGFATLSKGSNVIKAIPASNVKMVYTFEGYTKTPVGTPHITFFDKNDSPAAEPGDYTVVIPSNFITVNGQGNTPMEFHYKVTGTTVKVTPVPADMSTISELTTFKLKFNGASTVAFGGNLQSINIEYTDPDYVPDPSKEDETIPTLFIYASNVTVDGDEATVTFPTYTTEGQVFINVKAGAFKFTTPASSASTSNSEMLVRYFISPNAGDNTYTLTPANGTYAGGLTAYAQEEIPSQYAGQDPTLRNYYFTLNLPKDVTFGTISSRKTGLWIEQPDGSLKSTSYYFNNWVANEEKTSAQMYLVGEDNKELKLAPGTYWLVIPAKSFYVKTAGSTTMAPYSEELKFGPYVVEGEGAKYTITPSADDHITSLSEIVISFDEGSKVTVNPIAWFTLNNGPIEYDMRGKAVDNTVVITIDPAIDVVGEYTLVSEASNISVNGVNTAVEAVFVVERGFINEVKLLNNGQPVEAEIVEDEAFGSIWSVDVETALPSEGIEGPATGAITFELPYGYDAVYAMDYNVGFEPTHIYRESVENVVAAGYQKLPDNTMAGLTEGVHVIGFTYAAGEEALEPTFMKVTVVENHLTSVEAINVAEAAEYYTLQGVKVANPEKGIYIKVVNGKAAKVNL